MSVAGSSARSDTTTFLVVALITHPDRTDHIYGELAEEFRGNPVLERRPAAFSCEPGSERRSPCGSRIASRTPYHRHARRPGPKRRQTRTHTWRPGDKSANPPTVAAMQTIGTPRPKPPLASRTASAVGEPQSGPPQPEYPWQRNAGAIEFRVIDQSGRLGWADPTTVATVAACVADWPVATGLRPQRGQRRLLPHPPEDAGNLTIDLMRLTGTPGADAPDRRSG
jgi:hypothetical protein